MEAFKQLRLTAGIYQPTAPRTGNAGGSWLRLKNMILTGEDSQQYFTCYKGSLNISETIATSNLTGTLAGTIATKNIVGTGTAFKTELRQGQFVFAGTELFVVDQVTDDTHLTIYRALTAALVAATGKRLPVLFEINRKRGSLIQGNAIQLPKGTILATGTGTLGLNGAVLAGTSMVLTGSPQIAIYDPATGNYSVYALGMTTPAAPTVASVAGGVKNMQAGHYSLRIAPARIATQGYNNLSPKVEFDIAVSGNVAEVDISGTPLDSTHGQDARDVYGTESTSGGIEGPWFFVKQIVAADITANKFKVEWNNAEINRSGAWLFIDHGPPPAAGFVALLEGNPVWISCFGLFGGSPGPSLVPAEPRNIEAAPAEWVVSSNPSQNLLGVLTALSRLYVPAPNSLQQVVFAPGDVLDPPVSLRPYWHTGFCHPYQIAFANSMLIGYSHFGPTRSTVTESEDAGEQFFGGDVAEIIKDWTNGHVFVEIDPDPNVNAACVFHSADSKNVQGFWRTRVLVWGFRQNNWIGDVFIESATQDMIVSGVATVDNHLEFLAGGAVGGGVQVDTYRWNQSAGVAVDWFAAPQLSDGGSENQNKSVKSMRATGKFTSGNMQLHGYDSVVNMNLTDIENGTNSVSGNIPLASSSDVQQSAREPMNFPNLAVFTPRISGTYSGTGAVDRLDEVIVEFQEIGSRR